MKTLFQRLSPIAFVAAVLLLTGCQMLPMDSSATDGPVVEDAETATPAADEVTAAMAGTVDETDGPTATITVASLRLRAGPGVEYDVLGAALAGETFAVLGQAFNCQWLTAVHPSLGAVWFSGAPQYTAMNVACDQVAPAEAPATPTTPPAEETAASNESTQPTAVEEATEATVEATEAPSTEADAQTAEEAAAQTELAPPTPEPPAEPTAEPTVEAAAEPQAEPPSSENASSAQEPAEQGCYLIQGYAGPELTIEVSAIDWDWSGSFRFSGDGNQPYCFAPGRYNVTIVAPAIWKGLGSQLEVQPGVHSITPADLLQ